MSKVYAVDPSKVKFDPKIAQFNKPKDEAEYLALKASIEKYGQQEPILMRDELCGDGIHRVRAAMELGISVLAIDVDPSMTDKDFIALCNKNTFTARNDSPTQKAIKAYKLTKDFGYSDKEALLFAGINSESKVIGYARFIDSTVYGREYKILEKLQTGDAVRIGSIFTKSLDVARRSIAKMEEEELRARVDSALIIPTVDYDAMLETEAAKERFWQIYELDPTQQRLALVGLLNVLYKGADELVNTAKFTVSRRSEACIISNGEEV